MSAIDGILAGGCDDNVRLLYGAQEIEQYFRHGNGPQQIAHFRDSVEAANRFLADHPKETLRPGTSKPKGLSGALQYYKDETFLTLYAFASLDLLGKPQHREERERLFTALARRALPRRELTIRAPRLELEKQLSPPAAYLQVLHTRYREEAKTCHPVWYVRLLGAYSQSHEGATHSDGVLSHGEHSRMLVEAKFLSDISTSTTYAPERNQLTRNLDAGLAAVGGELERFAYVFVTPRCFRDRPESRFYGYKLREYMDPVLGPAALTRDLPHLARGVDFFAELSRRIGWVTWEEICGLLAASPVFRSPEFPREGLEQFFRERCLWPETA